MNHRIRSLLIILGIAGALYAGLIWINKVTCENRTGPDPVRYTYQRGCEIYTLEGWRNPGTLHQPEAHKDSR